MHSLAHAELHEIIQLVGREPYEILQVLLPPRWDILILSIALNVIMMAVVMCQTFSDADSGRSSCSGESSGIARVPAPQVARRTKEASTNTETGRLVVSEQPLRMGGLSNAFSSIDIASSTHLGPRGPVSRLRVRRQPVKRAASRLYRTGSVAVAGSANKEDLCIGPEFIVRATHNSKQLELVPQTVPERKTVVVILLNGQKIDVACDPNTTTAGEIFQLIIQSERLEHNFMLGISALVSGDFVFLPDDYKIRKVAPDSWIGNGSAKKKLLKKFTNVEEPTSQFTLFLRIKFFMPANLSKTVKGGSWRHWIYLQLRRSVVEGQLILQTPQLINLAGYALQAEFGNYSPKEHASGDYYLLEHYLPEGSYNENDKEIRNQIKQAHEYHYNMSREDAKEQYISIIQTYKDYGSHFYSAVWSTRDGYSRDVWLSISPRGLILYSRNTCISALPRDTYVSSRILLQSFVWQQIHTLYFNKKTLYVIPRTKSTSLHNAKLISKLKLKMEANKSYFTFWLASLHHSFYMRLHVDFNSLLNISDEFSVPISRDFTELSNKKEDWVDECSNYHDSYNLAVRGQFKYQRPKSLDNLNVNLEEFQNKENENPQKNNINMNLWAREQPLSDGGNASSSEVLSSPESCSLPRRLGVKMGTKAFNGQHRQFHSLDATLSSASPNFSDQLKKFTLSPTRMAQSDAEIASILTDSDEPLNPSHRFTVNKMSLLPDRPYSNMNSAYVIESPQVTNTFTYQPQTDDTFMNNSLQEKLSNMSCVQSERCFKTVKMIRDSRGTLGMQVAEGSDGNVYVKSVTPSGPASKTNQIQPGDQIISVNGQTLLNLKYNKALELLQKASEEVEIIFLQSINADKKHAPQTMISKLLRGESFSKLSAFNPNAKAANNIQVEKNKSTSELFNNDLLNVEALKTINVLLALTKRNLERKNNNEDQADSGDSYKYSSSTESTPSKNYKRRPLSINLADIDNGNITSSSLSNRTRSCDNITVLKGNSPHITQIDRSAELQNRKNTIPQALKNSVISRRWTGHVKYPVTPSKTTTPTSFDKTSQSTQFTYGNAPSDEEQIFI